MNSARFDPVRRLSTQFADQKRCCTCARSLAHKEVLSRFTCGSSLIHAHLIPYYRDVYDGL